VNLPKSPFCGRSKRFEPSSLPSKSDFPALNGCVRRKKTRSPADKERGALSPMRFLKVLCLLAACSGAVKAQTDQTGVFHETATGLTMRFPVELVVRDAQKSIDEGHVAVFGLHAEPS